MTRSSRSTAAVYLVNTLPGFDGDDTLQTPADLDALPRREPLHRARCGATTPRSRRCAASARACAQLWDVDRDGAVPLVNEMLRDGQRAPPARRSTTTTTGTSTRRRDDAPLATRILVEAAMAFVDVIRADEYDRVRVCSADDCESVYIDYSKNGSKRYCDTGNCGNRMNVNAYRQRKARETV